MQIYNLGIVYLDKLSSQMFNFMVLWCIHVNENPDFFHIGLNESPKFSIPDFIYKIKRKT